MIKTFKTFFKVLRRGVKKIWTHFPAVYSPYQGIGTDAFKFLVNM